MTKLDIEIVGSVDEAVAHLNAAIRAQAPTTVLEFSKPRLAGDVSAQEVMLIRRRSRSHWYGLFRGRFEQHGVQARLTGHFIRDSGHFMRSWASTAITWGIFLSVLVIDRWRGVDSIALLVATLGVMAAGVVAIWLRAKNARAEAQLLSDELAAILNQHGA
jgi:hypothetical protein